MDEFERRQQRLDRARSLIHAELAIAVLVPVLAGFLFIAAPPCMCPMFEREPSRIESILPWAAVAMYLVGLVWMVRLSRSYREDGQSYWRYRDRQRRLDRARWLIRTELTIAISVALLAGLLFIAAPHHGFGMYGEGPTRGQWLVMCAGVAMYVVGLVWMIRLSRSYREDGESSWRYRDF